VVVTGIPLPGKKIACQRAAGYSDFVPFVHLREESAGFLQLGQTIAEWFQYIDDREISALALSVMERMNKGQSTYAHDLLVKLADLALKKGHRACFLIDRIQNLDTFSLSLIRECLQRKQEICEPARSHLLSLDNTDFDLGKICFLCVCTPAYNCKSATDIVKDLTRSHTLFQIPIVEIGEAIQEELQWLFRDLLDTEVEDTLLDTYSEASGHCAGYFIERSVAVQHLSAIAWIDGELALTAMSMDQVLHIPRGHVRENKELKVTQIRGEIATRFSQLYDELPPLCQITVLRSVMNDLMAQGVELSVFAIISLVKIEYQVIMFKETDANPEPFGNNDNGMILIQNPALANIIIDVCTPVQVCSIASTLIERLGETFTHNFEVSLVAASLDKVLGQNVDIMKHLWLQGYQGFLEECEFLSEKQINMWLVTIDNEIRSAGYESKDILGANFCVPTPIYDTLSTSLFTLKVYMAPVALGPVGQTLSVLCRNTFHEFRTFYGATEEEILRLRSATSSACSCC
jgi:hypothetical protein